ncbi:hypothetical protein D3C72_1453740 [compost metagenome]
MLGVGVLGTADGNHLDLRKLVLTDQAARITPRRPGLGPETGRQGRQTHGLRHLVLGQNLLTHEVGQGDFGRGDQQMLARAEQVFLELRKLAGAEHGVVLDHVGRRDFEVAVRARLQVQHELADGAFQPGQLALQHGEARTGHLGRGLEVQQAHGLA